jgi:M6 family metalloprotease-like protein
MKAQILTFAALAFLLAPGSVLAQGQPASAADLGASLPHGRSSGTYQMRSLERLALGAPEPVDSLNVIVLTVSFADRDVDAAHGAVYFENELRHLREYFLGASGGVFHLRTDLFPSVVKLSGTEGYYGDDDLWAERMAELLIELVQKTDASVDYSRYDAVAVIHAGAGQETDFNGDSEWQIGSGFVNPGEMAGALRDTLGTPGVPTNDRVNGDTLFIDNLMVWPEEASQDGYTFGSLGICAYQLGLRLGMVTLYDSTPEGYPDSQGIGNFDIMGYGIYNALGFVPAFPSAFNRYLMGWVKPVVVDGDRTVRLADVSSAGPLDTALVKIPLNPSEYYLVENRVHDTNFNGKFDFNDLNHNGVPENGDTLLGAEFDFFLTATTNMRPKADSVVTGSGLMIYHVDEAAIRRAVESGGYPNDDRFWKGVDIEEADHVQDLDSPSGGFAFGSFYDSFRKDNNDRFGPDSDPSTADNAGVRTGVEIDEISAAGHFMTFRTRFSPPMDFTRGEFSADIARLSPIAVPGSTCERLLIAADTASLYLADAGLAAWDGTVEKLPIENGGTWMAPPIRSHILSGGQGEIYITSSGGTLHAYDFSGGSVPIDDDGTPGTLKLRGDVASSLIVGPGTFTSSPVHAYSSTSDSTYLMVVGSGGPWPVAGWVKRGPLGMETGLMEGQIVSNPAAGLIEEVGDNGIMWSKRGEYVVTYEAGRGICFNFVAVTFGGEPGPQYDHITHSRKETGILQKPNAPITVATGDIDRDGSDEMVAAIDGAGLYYFKDGEDIHHVRLPESRYSSPVLADIDGDGTLETALRDESRCYLFSGFGVPVRGWPRAIDEAVIGHEDLVSVPPPVVDDVNGDGSREIVFLAAGDIHAFNFNGREFSGWPLPGEGARGGALALLLGESGKLYLVDCAAVVPHSAREGAGAASGAVSSIRRYDPKVEAGTTIQTWRTYRHDSYGYARQGNRGSIENPRAERVDASTFIVYPNPATGPTFTARVLISAPARVTVTLLNIEGEKVVERKRDHAWFEGSAVPFEERFSTGGLSGGVYICRIEVTGDGWGWNGSKRFAVIR